MEKKEFNWKLLAIIMTVVALVASGTAISFSQRPSSYFGIESNDDGTVSFIAGNAQAASSGTASVIVEDGQEIVVRTGLAGNGSIHIKITPAGGTTPVVDQTLKAIDVSYFEVDAGNYDVLATVESTATGYVTIDLSEGVVAVLDESNDNQQAGDPLSLWTDSAQAKGELTEYIEAVTDENSSDYIPVEYRIAVFDLDGTLFCETDPNYFDYTLLVHRVLEDEDYKDKASDFEKETAQKIVTLNETGEAAKGLEVDHGKAVASAFSGLTLDEFNDYIQEFKKLEMPSYDGMLRGDGWYRPMLEVVDYLQDNDFTVYVVSGTDRFIVRGIVYDSLLNVPANQIIGSDETIVTREQEDVDGLDYVFTDTDELILGGDFVVKNLKMNKVAVIAQEIGYQPVLSFGNSTGDSSMAEYATSSNPFRSLAFMLCCDDTERENGNIEKADKMYSLCEDYDWIPISMKNDWTTIYGEGVTKK